MTHRTDLEPAPAPWWSPPPRVRGWLYLVGLAVVPLLVFYGLVTEDAAPLWVALLAAVLAPVPNAVARAHLEPQDQPRAGR